MSWKSAHWTQGAYDVVVITEGPEEAQMTLALKLAAPGNVRTKTLRGYSVAEMRKFVATI